MQFPSDKWRLKKQASGKKALDMEVWILALNDKKPQNFGTGDYLVIEIVPFRGIPFVSIYYIRYFFEV